jgi:hypothetical protein
MMCPCCRANFVIRPGTVFVLEKDDSITRYCSAACAHHHEVRKAAKRYVANDKDYMLAARRLMAKSAAADEAPLPMPTQPNREETTWREREPML